MSRFPPFSRQWIDYLQQRVASLPNGLVTINPALKVPMDHGNINPKRKQAAVLVPLCNCYGVPSILFIQRAKTMTSYKGQVAFPGGHLGKGEGAIKAAIRETNEELGDTVGDIRIIGGCQPIPAMTSDTIVMPIVGFLEEDVIDFEYFIPNDEEVDHVFTRSLEMILSPGFRQEETFTRDEKKITLPSYGSGEERIWGLTAVILDAVMRDLIIPSISVDD